MMLPPYTSMTPQFSSTSGPHDYHQKFAAMSLEPKLAIGPDSMTSTNGQIPSSQTYIPPSTQHKTTSMPYDSYPQSGPPTMPYGHPTQTAGYHGQPTRQDQPVSFRDQQPYQDQAVGYQGQPLHQDQPVSYRGQPPYHDLPVGYRGQPTDQNQLPVGYHSQPPPQDLLSDYHSQTTSHKQPVGYHGQPSMPYQPATQPVTSPQEVIDYYSSSFKSTGGPLQTTTGQNPTNLPLSGAAIGPAAVVEQLSRSAGSTPPQQNTPPPSRPRGRLSLPQDLSTLTNRTPEEGLEPGHGPSQDLEPLTPNSAAEFEAAEHNCDGRLTRAMEESQIPEAMTSIHNLRKISSDSSSLSTFYHGQIVTEDTGSVHPMSDEEALRMIAAGEKPQNYPPR